MDIRAVSQFYFICGNRSTFCFWRKRSIFNADTDIDFHFGKAHHIKSNFCVDQINVYQTTDSVLVFFERDDAE